MCYHWNVFPQFLPIIIIIKKPKQKTTKQNRKGDKMQTWKISWAKSQNLQDTPTAINNSHSEADVNKWEKNTLPTIKTMKICIALLTHSCEELLKSRTFIYTKVFYYQSPQSRTSLLWQELFMMPMFAFFQPVQANIKNAHPRSAGYLHFWVDMTVLTLSEEDKNLQQCHCVNIIYWKKISQLSLFNHFCHLLPSKLVYHDWIPKQRITALEFLSGSCAKTALGSGLPGSCNILL